MKTIFKITVVLFLLNVLNIIGSFIFLIYKWIGFFETNNHFIEYLLVCSVLAIVPIAVILIGLLNYESKKK